MPRTRGPAVGATVVAKPGALKGADPFTKLVVTEVGKGGITVTVLGGGGPTWRKVRPKDLTVVPA